MAMMIESAITVMMTIKKMMVALMVTIRIMRKTTIYPT